MPLKGLVVEDEPAILRLLVTVLEDLGYEATGAADAETALEFLLTSTVDLIIADVKLPGMDGVQMVRQIRDTLDPQPQRILLTSAFGEPIGHRGDAFIAKPFDLERLVSYIQP